jgi:hypothetical protein
MDYLQYPTLDFRDCKGIIISFRIRPSGRIHAAAEHFTLHTDPIILGWREWLALPDFGIAAIKAKVDSGARTSALHVESLAEHERDGQIWLRFTVLTGRRGAEPVLCEARAAERRAVIDSGGHKTLRWFINTQFELAGQRWHAQVNLTSRRDMLFPLLLGRNALSGRFIADPAAAYRYGRPRRKRRMPQGPI